MVTWRQETTWLGLGKGCWHVGPIPFPSFTPTPFVFERTPGPSEQSCKRKWSKVPMRHQLHYDRTTLLCYSGTMPFIIYLMGIEKNGCLRFAPNFMQSSNRPLSFVMLNRLVYANRAPTLLVYADIRGAVPCAANSLLVFSEISGIICHSGNTKIHEYVGLSCINQQNNVMLVS